MSAIFCEVVKNIYRLKVPFDNIYTSVFLIKTDNGAMLVDSATTIEDVDEYTIPALNALGYEITDINTLVLTHHHSDHAGGKDGILSLAPDISVVNSVCEICNGISTYSMTGHTEDSIGVLDMRTSTLISGDGLQGAGVDKYRCYLKAPKEYIKTVEKIKNDKRIENILFSHAYEPWNKDSAIGRDEVKACLEACIIYEKGE